MVVEMFTLLNVDPSIEMLIKFMFISILFLRFVYFRVISLYCLLFFVMYVYS